MQGSLVIIFFSVLLTTGAALTCESCQSMGDSCTGKRENCEAGKDVCATVWSESMGNKTSNSVLKTCYEKAKCNSGGSSIMNGVNTTTTIQCSKAPPSRASLLLALSGILMMKILM